MAANTGDPTIRDQVVRLRTANPKLTFRAIGESLGVSGAAAYYHWRRHCLNIPAPSPEQAIVCGVVIDVLGSAGRPGHVLTRYRVRLDGGRAATLGLPGALTAADAESLIAVITALAT